MIMRQNYFLDFFGGGLAVSVSVLSGNTSSTLALRTLPTLLSTVHIFSHSGAELHRLNAHRAQAS
jgi:hypothetical protein